MPFLRVLSLVLIAAGFAMVFAARWAVGKFGLDSSVKCEFDHEMGEDELKQYKYNKAVVNFKMYGMLAAVPGLVLFFIAFR